MEVLATLEPPIKKIIYILELNHHETKKKIYIFHKSIKKISIFFCVEIYN